MPMQADRQPIKRNDGAQSSERSDKRPLPEPADLMWHLQRTAGNRAVQRFVGASRHLFAANTRGTVAQRFGDMSILYKTNWKYSGGTIATNSAIDPLWHATVFRVDKSGTATANGLFYNGFHLTMEYREGDSRLDPHVFFDSSGEYDAAATLKHAKTKAYKTAVGDAQWAFDLGTAKDLAQSVLATLGPSLSEQERETIENEARAKKEKAKEEGEVEKAEALEKEKQAALKAATAKDESTSIDVLLKDVRYLGGPYKAQFMEYIGGNKQAIKDTGLKKVAEWYLGGRDKGHWTVTEKPQAAYKSWTDKTPIKVTWPSYANSVSWTWRAKSETGLMSEHRQVTFNGYASYKLHPLARKPPQA